MIRAKSNLNFYVVQSRPVDRAIGPSLRPDNPIARLPSPAPIPWSALRRIRFYDAESDLSLVFLTNNFELPALTVASIYRERWQIKVVLPLDQAAPAAARVLLHESERRTRSGLECHQRIPLGGDRQTGTGPVRQLVPNPANCLDLRS